MSWRNIRKGISQAACGLAVFLGTLSAAFAGSFSVNPVRATLSADQRVAALTVRNNGVEPTVIQIEVLDWSQRNGSNVHAPTSELLATPPIFTVAPGGTQVVRVGLRHAPDPQREVSYRIFLREVPSATSQADSFQGLKIALAMSIPVFTIPPIAATPQVTWRALRRAEGTIELQAANSGNGHVQIGRFELALADRGTVIVEQQSAQYVLPDNTRTWVLKPSIVLPAGSALSISAQTDAGPMRARLVLEEAAASSGVAAVSENSNPVAHR